jgi:hypothetical protein
MALFETLTLTLAPAVAKSILKLWLPEKSLALGVGEGIIETLKKYGESYATARSVDRLFRGLADDMADRLFQTIEIEFPTLPESDREAAVLAVADVFKSLDLSESMMRADLNAIGLELLARPLAKPVFATLGGDAEGLAELVLRECCAYAVGLAGKLPDFHAAATREILRRHTELLAELTRILDALTAMRAQSSGNDLAANFETRYRRVLVQRLDRMQLFGVRLVSGSTREIELSVAYVTLTSKHPGSVQNRDVNSALSGIARAVIRGEAGSGKTTLLQWLAIRAANRDFPEALAKWNNHVPFYVALRQYSDKPFPTPEKLVLGVASNVADLMPGGWTHQALSSGALMLIDGIDEVPASRRGEFFEWLRGIAEDFPNATFILSSRPAALDAPMTGASAASRLAKLGFAQVVLEPMSLADSEALVSQWHQAVALDTTDPTDLAMLETYERNLIRALRERPAIRSLASSPLLCSMICVLNWDRKQQLPDNRMELYGSALESLLDRRDSDRDIKPAVLSVLDRASKEALLDGIALWMMRNGFVEADATDIKSQVGLLLQRLPAIPNVEDVVLQELLERSGVLRRPSSDTVDFIHRTFLEFMAARAAVRTGDFGFLAKQAAEESWRETIVFAVGHAQGRQRDQLVGKLLQTPFFFFRTRSVEADVTAACCLETASSNLDPALLGKLRACAESLFPPRSQKDARILAPAAQLNPTLLKGHDNEGEDTVAACIRCAAINGGELMLEVVESYANVPGDIVWSELILAWTAFDADRFLQRVIRKRRGEVQVDVKFEELDEDTLKCLQLLVLKGIYDKSPTDLAAALHLFAKSRALRIGERTYGEVDEPIALSRVASAVSGASNSLALRTNPKTVTVLDAQRLAMITSLKTLTLGRCERGALKAIAGLPALGSLSCHVTDVSELVELTQCKTLEKLNVSGLSIPNRIQQAERYDLRALAECPKLETLEVVHFRAAVDLSLPINAQLKNLRLAYVPMSTISQLRFMQGLLRVSVQVDEIPGGELDLENFKGLTELVVYTEKPVRLRLPSSLTTLRLYKCPVVKIVNPQMLTNLEVLNLASLGGLEPARDLLAMSKLRYVSIDDKTRDAIGEIPERWANG